MNFEQNTLILIFLYAICFYMQKEILNNSYYLVKESIEEFILKFLNQLDMIKQLKDHFGQSFQKRTLSLLPLQTKQQNFIIIKHYEKYLVGYLQKYSNQIKCKNNEILYAEFNNNNFESYTGYGFQFKVNYDRNYNPNYELYEGEFKNGQKHGKGKIFGQKSENIVQEGEWKYNKLKQNQNYDTNNNQQQLQNDQQPNIKIIIKNGDEIIKQNINQRKNQRKIENWIKFNQLISENDIAILKSRNKWFTSSIIDSFVLYININIEEQYFQIDPNLRKQTLRQIFVPSSVFTQMRNKQIDSNIQIFQNHFLEYKRINYQIEKIYNRINFIINRNNTHWFLIQLNMQNYDMIVMDSIKHKEESYNFVKDILNPIFENKIQKIIISNKCIYQNNGYDCGPYTCLHMLQISEIQLKLETPFQMREFLLEQLKQN